MPVAHTLVLLVGKLILMRLPMPMAAVAVKMQEQQIMAVWLLVLVVQAALRQD
jgi:hypothetical protein